MKNWIQKVVKHPGSFTEWCKQQGFNGVTEECIARGCKSKNKTIRSRACLARTLKKLSKKK